ncbi:hypothetical protein CDEN61S_00776 [Castellaniella denitrificans]
MNLKDRGPDGLLVLPHVRVQNANAISSSLTHGFPSMTAFLGFMWALGRKLAQADIPLKLEKIGVICHWHQEQTQEGYVRTFRLTRNPVDKDGSTAAIVEEGRIHLDLTLVFQLGVIEQEGETHPLFHSDGALRQKIAWDIRNLVEAMRIAGGSVLPPKPGPGIRVTPSLIGWPDQEAERQALFRRLRRQWLPGFALVGRDDLLQRRLEQLRLQGETYEQAVQAIPDGVERQPDLPYVQLRSASTGQRFCLFLALGDAAPQPVAGVFNAYGLSSTATLPWF